MAKKKITTAELHQLLAKPGVRIGTFVSLRSGEARVEVVTPDRTFTVTVVDPRSR
ncbi:MAG: hypothetical protein JW895_02815 [Thermoleophilaceae bacterium]|nr:hypothetical protein [Thermoleophilaceae bacterium]